MVSYFAKIDILLYDSSMTTSAEKLPPEILSNPDYFGKHVVVVDSEVFVATTGDEAVRLLEEVRKKHPDKQPILAYIPKEETLILVIWK